MIAYKLATKGLDTESFPQHTIVKLNSGIIFILLFSQKKPLRREGINTHTYIHTHTRTRTHAHRLATEKGRGRMKTHPREKKPQQLG